MLTRGVYYIAAFVVASAAVVGYAVLNQLSFPAACGMMVLFTGLLAVASDVTNGETGQNDRSHTAATLSNHLQMPSVVPGTLSNRETRDLNDSNNANCIRSHSDVELSTFSGVGTATLSGRTSASGHVVHPTNSSLVLSLPRATEAERTNRVQLFGGVPSHIELRRPPIGSRHRVAPDDSIQVQAPVITSMTPSGSDLWTTSIRSQQHLLPPFHRLPAGWVLDCESVSKHAYKLRRVKLVVATGSSLRSANSS